MSTIKGRLAKVEQSHKGKAALPKLWLWRDMDGQYSLGGEKWPSVEAVHAAHPGEYDPEGTIVFSWKNSRGENGQVSE
jgi:hypothetical protein